MIEIRLKRLLTDPITEDKGINELLEVAKEHALIPKGLNTASILDYQKTIYKSPVILLESPAGDKAVISKRNNGYFLDIYE